MGEGAPEVRLCLCGKYGSCAHDSDRVAYLLQRGPGTCPQEILNFRSSEIAGNAYIPTCF